MKTIIIYGTECDENTAWIPWLKNELEENGIECIVPALPTTENQTYKSWEKLLNQEIDIDQSDTIVAWSTGAIFIVRYLFENNIRVNKLILVSGFNNYVGNVEHVDKINKDFFMDEVSAARNVADEKICVISDNDPFITQEALHSFANKLDAKLVVIKNGGHFNLNAGYDKFNELLDLIIK